MPTNPSTYTRTTPVRTVKYSYRESIGDRGGRPHKDIRAKHGRAEWRGLLGSGRDGVWATRP
ncbi:hypothetical protein MyChFU_28630 [Mycobacterium intracellulare subsp. chimaera]